MASGHNIRCGENYAAKTSPAIASRVIPATPTCCWNWPTDDRLFVDKKLGLHRAQDGGAVRAQALFHLAKVSERKPFAIALCLHHKACDPGKRMHIPKPLG